MEQWSDPQHCLEEEPLVGLAAGGQAASERLLDARQPVDGEAFGEEGGEAIVELLGGGLGRCQLFLCLLAAAS
jgi:hypothetical protein